MIRRARRIVIPDFDIVQLIKIFFMTKQYFFLRSMQIEYASEKYRRSRDE